MYASSTGSTMWTRLWSMPTPPPPPTYTDIPVGVHAFHIRASNGDGVWDREGIVYNVTQQPFFYQTMTFRVASLIAGALLLVGLYQLRLRQAAARLNARLEERLLERE